MPGTYTPAETELLEQYRAAGKAVEDAALTDFLAVYAVATSRDVPRFQAQLVPIYESLVTRYGSIQAELAAQFYDELRSMRDTDAPFTASPAAVATAAALEANVRSALRSMFTPGDGGGPDAVSTRVQGSMLRQIRTAGRRTIAEAARAERADTGKGPRVARILRGEYDCPWCVMLASRGAVYFTKESALAPTKGWHDHCDCELLVVPEQRWPAGYSLTKVRELYYLNQYGSDTSKRVYPQSQGKAARRRAAEQAAQRAARAAR